MRKSKITIVGLLLVCLLMVSGCGLFSSKENENDLDTQSEEIVKQEDAETEDGTESLIEETQAQEIEVTETTEREETESEKNTENDSKQEESISSKEPEIAPTDSQTQTNPQPPAQPEAPEVYVVDMVTEQETLAPEVYKYGVTKTGVVDRTYEVYSDGSRVCVAEYPSYRYDSSTYSASDAEIQLESDTNCNSYMGYYNEVLALVNQIRAEAGVGPLTLDTNLCRASSMRALEMDYANYFAHARADGRECFSAMDFYGCSYGWAGENIAAGYRSPASVVEGWRISQGHYENMVNPNFTKLGVGYCNTGIGDYGHYWVQLFSD